MARVGVWGGAISSQHPLTLLCTSSAVFLRRIGKCLAATYQKVMAAAASRVLLINHSRLPYFLDGVAVREGGREEGRRAGAGMRASGMSSGRAERKHPSLRLTSTGLVGMKTCREEER